jgi:hypothetical protein
LAAQLDIGRLAAHVSSIHQLNKTAVTAEIFATTSDQKGRSSRRLKWIAANLSCHMTDVFEPPAHTFLLRCCGEARNK